MEKKRFGLIEVMVRTLFFTKTYKNLSKPNIWIYLIGSRSEQEIHSEPYPNEGTEKHTIFILTLIKKKKSIRVFMILVDFLLDKI